MLNHLKNSFIYSLEGLRTTWHEERNFRIEVGIAVLLVIFLFYFEFTYIEWLFCIIAMTIVLVSEIINTIVEDLCNKIEPTQNPVIKKIKDMAAAFVLLSALGAALIGFLVFYNHFL